MFSLKNNICVWSSIDRRFFKMILVSSISLFLFDLVFRTAVTTLELCGVARAFVHISENGPRSKNFGYPCIKANSVDPKRNQ